MTDRQQQTATKGARWTDGGNGKKTSGSSAVNRGFIWGDRGSHVSQMSRGAKRPTAVGPTRAATRIIPKRAKDCLPLGGDTGARDDPRCKAVYGTGSSVGTYMDAVVYGRRGIQGRRRGEGW